MNKNLVAILIVGLLLSVLWVLYGQKLTRQYNFHQSITEMLDHTKSGNISKAMSVVSKPQQQQATEIASTVLGSDFHTHIESLRLTGFSWVNDDTITAMVTCKLNFEGANPIYQGKLLWRFTQGDWVWDFSGSYVGEYAGLEEPAWVKLGDMLSTMERH